MSFQIGVFFSEEMVNVDSIYKVGPRKTSYVYVGAHISTRVGVRDSIYDWARGPPCREIIQ